MRRELRRIRKGPTDHANEPATRLYTHASNLRLRHGAGTRGRQGSLCGMWRPHSRSPPPTGSQGKLVSPLISIAPLRLLARATVSRPSLRYLATVPRLVTGPKLLNLPDGPALSFMLKACNSLCYRTSPSTILRHHPVASTMQDCSCSSAFCSPRGGAWHNIRPWKIK